MKLLGSTKSKITKDQNGENVPHLEVAELILIHCNLVNSYHPQISPPNHIFLKTFNSEFQ